MELIGRERELARLRSLRAGMVVLAGEPGIGKTSLLRALCSDRDALAGAATEFETGVPFALFADAFSALGAARVQRLSRGDDELAALLEGAFVPGLGGERFRLHQAVRMLLDRLSAARDVLLVLDDAHWADSASVELIAHLARRPPALPIVLALRPGQTPGALARALRGCERLSLGPLTRAQAVPLLAGVPSAVRDAVYERSGGNPFFIDALARGGAGPVPGEVMDALADELAALSPEALAFARGAAVASEPFAPELAAAAAELPDAAGLAALDELVAAELVAATGVPRQFRFRHPLVRQAIYAEAGPGWRLGAHARVASVLARQGAAPGRRAHHVEQCAQPGDRVAIAVLDRAAADAASRAPASAARWWSAALRLLPAEATQDERLAMLVPMATSLGAAGELAASRDALQDVLELVDQPELRGRLVAFIAMLEQFLGRQDRAQALLAETLAAQPDPGSRAATALRLELAMQRYFVADWQGMRAHAAESLPAARGLGDAGLIARAAGTLALAEYHVADVPTARLLLDEAATRLDGLSDDALAGNLDTALVIGWGEQCVARWDDVHRHYERALAVGRATGQGYLLVPLTIGRSIASAWQGRLECAGEFAEEALEAAQLSGNGQSLTWALTVSTWVATLAGDLDRARELGRQAVDVAAGLAESHWGGLSGCYLAEARLEAGEDARADLLRAAGGPDLPLIERAFKPQWYEILVRAELARGDSRPAQALQAAETYAHAAERAAAGLGLPARTGQAQRARAAVLLAQGQAARAAEAARAAARHSHRAGNVLDAARSHLLAGRALAASGRTAEATLALTAALEHPQATRLHAEAARELRRLGKPVARSGPRARRPERGVEALTEREHEIAGLITDGLTNRRIAARLHVSPKTVETHVAHIFAKLGVHSRAAAAAALSGSVQGRRARLARGPSNLSA